MLGACKHRCQGFAAHVAWPFVHFCALTEQPAYSAHPAPAAGAAPGSRARPWPPCSGGTKKTCSALRPSGGSWRRRTASWPGCWRLRTWSGWQVGRDVLCR